MALITTFSVPESWLERLIPAYTSYARINGAGWVRSEVRRLLTDAVMAGVSAKAPTKPETGPGVSVNVSFAEPAAGVIRAKAKELGLSPGPYCRALLAALLELPANTVSYSVKADGVLGEVIEWSRRNGQQFEFRSEQAMFYSQLRDALSDRNIGLCEAATGIGKTVALLCAAVEILRDKPGRVLIATPTIALMRQYAATYQIIKDAVGGPDLRVVVGRREFVSPHEVRSLLATGRGAFDAAVVTDWLNRGGIAETADPLGLPWLASSLQSVCQEFPVNDVLLPEVVSCDDPAYITYKAQFREDRDRQREIMLVTHAMLAQDVRSRNRLIRENDVFKDIDEEFWNLVRSIRTLKGEERNAANKALAQISNERSEMILNLTEENGLLPQYTILLVDEAHLLEQNFSQALSDYVSLRAFSRLLSEYRNAGGKIAKIHIKNIESAIDKISDLGKNIPRDPYHLAIPGVFSAQFVSLIRQIADEARQVKPPKGDITPTLAALYTRIRRDIAVLTLAGNQSDFNNRALIQFSPVRSWPQVYVARANVKTALNLLWEYAYCGAAVSATLYLRKGNGFSAGFQRLLLSIPSHRAKEYQPVSPAWLVHPVVGLWVPESIKTDNARGWWLRPPSQKDRLDEYEQTEEEKAWLAEVSEAILRIHDTAHGGMLVLMTSYDSARILAAMLACHLREKLVVAEPGWRLHAQQELFERKALAGEKPIWIAVGSAWTGIDVGGHNYGIPAAEDNVFTDLVIPRLPFGTNRSMTHQYRMSYEPGVPWDTLDAAFRTKQALGRLVRREGLPQNRRIFVLDGRLSDPGFKGYLSIIRGLFDRYESKVFTKNSN